MFCVLFQNTLDRLIAHFRIPALDQLYNQLFADQSLCFAIKSGSAIFDRLGDRSPCYIHHALQYPMAMVKNISRITLGVIIDVISIPSLIIGIALLFIGLAEVGVLLAASAYVNIRLTHYYVFRKDGENVTEKLT